MITFEATITGKENRVFCPQTMQSVCWMGRFQDDVECAMGALRDGYEQIRCALDFCKKVNS